MLAAEELDSIYADIGALIEDAVAYAESSPEPVLESLHVDLFAN